MEPKSIAFYTAVAVSILAVISATTLPIYAQETTPNETDNQENEESEANAGGEENAGEQGGQQSGDAPASDALGGRSLSLPPSSSMVSCGQTITQSVDITRDMVCPEGLRISGSDITVNFNGHKLTGGSAEESSLDEPGFGQNAGITVAGGDNIDIIGGGQISDYGIAINVVAGNDISIAEMFFSENSIGVQVMGAEVVSVHKSSFTNNDIGQAVIESTDVVNAFNGFVGNSMGGLYVEGSTEGVVAASSFFGNGVDSGQSLGGVYLDSDTIRFNVDYNNMWANLPNDLHIGNDDNIIGPNNNCGTSVPVGFCSGQTGQTEQT